MSYNIIEDVCVCCNFVFVAIYQTILLSFQQVIWNILNVLCSLISSQDYQLWFFRCMHIFFFFLKFLWATSESKFTCLCAHCICNGELSCSVHVIYTVVMQKRYKCSWTLDFVYVSVFLDFFHLQSYIVIISFIWIWCLNVPEFTITCQSSFVI